MITATIRTIIQSIHELAKQAYVLATGLQNAAPPGASLQSVQYLLETAAQLERAKGELENLLQNHHPENELSNMSLQLVRASAEKDEELRKKYDMENKFRFVRERVQTLLSNLEQESASTAYLIKNESKGGLLDDEMAVYVYLYNAKGLALLNWQNMLVPKVFYEYSVNRPIYTEKSYIETLLRSKSNRSQHAYLTVAIKATDIIQAEVKLKDNLGNPLVKIREGSLLFNKLLAFTYDGEEYILNERGELIKKLGSS